MRTGVGDGGESSESKVCGTGVAPGVKPGRSVIEGFRSREFGEASIVSTVSGVAWIAGAGMSEGVKACSGGGGVGFGVAPGTMGTKRESGWGVGAAVEAGGGMTPGASEAVGVGVDAAATGVSPAASPSSWEKARGTAAIRKITRQAAAGLLGDMRSNKLMRDRIFKEEKSIPFWRKALVNRHLGKEFEAGGIVGFLGLERGDGRHGDRGFPGTGQGEVAHCHHAG